MYISFRHSDIQNIIMLVVGSCNDLIKGEINTDQTPV